MCGTHTWHHGHGAIESGSGSLAVTTRVLRRAKLCGSPQRALLVKDGQAQVGAVVA